MSQLMLQTTYNLFFSTKSNIVLVTAYKFNNRIAHYELIGYHRPLTAFEQYSHAVDRWSLKLSECNQEIENISPLFLCMTILMQIVHFVISLAIPIIVTLVTNTIDLLKSYVLCLLVVGAEVLWLIIVNQFESKIRDIHVTHYRITFFKWKNTVDSFDIIIGLMFMVQLFILFRNIFYLQINIWFIASDISLFLLSIRTFLKLKLERDKLLQILLQLRTKKQKIIHKTEPIQMREPFQMGANYQRETKMQSQPKIMLETRETKYEMKRRKTKIINKCSIQEQVNRQLQIYTQ